MIAAFAADRLKEARDNARQQNINAAATRATTDVAADCFVTTPVTSGEGSSNISSVDSNA
jgi:hypothetical protein